MNSTLSKIFKAAIALMLSVCLCLPFAGCTKNTKNVKNVDQICVSGSYAESWMYVFTNQDFIDDMVEVFNNIKYEKTDETVDMMTVDDVLFFTFSNGNSTLSKLIVDKNGIMTFEAGTDCYKIVSDFDFDYVKELVNKQIDAMSSPVATPDQLSAD